jgi:ribosome-binding factor A
MAERRPERVAHLIQSALASWLLREAADPRLRRLTVTAVKVSPDLRLARVWVRDLAEAPAPAADLQVIRRAARAMRSAVARALDLRVTPELRFEYDTLPDDARRLDELLRDAAPEHDDGDDS